jgi:hypothetical protein
MDEVRFQQDFVVHVPATRGGLAVQISDHIDAQY